MNKKLIYQVALHGLIILLLFKTDSYERFKDWAKLTDVDAFDSSYYQSILHHQLRQDSTIESGTAVYFGDSMIQGLNVVNIQSKSLNFGIAGETSADLLKRITQYKATIKTERIIISVGINDLGFRTVSDITGNIFSILQYIPSTSTVYLFAVLPISKTLDQQGVKRLSDGHELNIQLKQLASKQINWIYTAPPPNLSGEHGFLKNTYHTGDGLHLNEAGYNTWTQYLKNTFASFHPAQ